MTRVLMFGLLAVVATAAAVLSFSALRDLGLACGFDPRLAWLVPVVVDAGAAAGSVAWLSQPAGTARMFGRRLAVVLLAASVIGNAVAHVLEAYRLEAPWWLVVAVSALAPAVLGAVVHLVVLVVQDDDEPGDVTEKGALLAGTPSRESGFFPDPGATRVGGDGGGVRRPDSQVRSAGDLETPGDSIFGDPGRPRLRQLPGTDNLYSSSGGDEPVSTRLTVDPEDQDRAAELIAEGAGRRRLAKELGITEHQARELLAGSRVEQQAGAR